MRMVMALDTPVPDQPVSRAGRRKTARKFGAYRLQPERPPRDIPIKEVLVITYALAHLADQILKNEFPLMIGHGFPHVGLPFACRNQVLQTAFDVSAPSVRAGVVALIFGNQALVGEADFGFVALPGDIKNNVGARPLGGVRGKIEVVVQDTPNDFFAGTQFSYLDLATMDIAEVIFEFRAELVGAAFDFFRPPATDIGDGSEGCFRRLADREGSGEVVIFHGYLLFRFLR
jgi:hypothetical protein